jgi:hypothetical protein
MRLRLRDNCGPSCWRASCREESRVGSKRNSIVCCVDARCPYREFSFRRLRMVRRSAFSRTSKSRSAAVLEMPMFSSSFPCPWAFSSVSAPNSGAARDSPLAFAFDSPNSLNEMTGHEHTTQRPSQGRTLANASAFWNYEPVCVAQPEAQRRPTPLHPKTSGMCPPLCPPATQQ